MDDFVKEVTKEADRVAKKQKLSSSKAVETLQLLIADVQTARSQIGSLHDPASRTEAYKAFQQRVSERLADVTATQAAGRELNAVVARLGKARSCVSRKPDCFVATLTRIESVENAEHRQAFRSGHRESMVEQAHGFCCAEHGAGEIFGRDGRGRH
jgi:multidrug efflux pump subunit AcrA (membrane-fusion protein)